MALDYWVCSQPASAALSQALKSFLALEQLQPFQDLYRPPLTTEHKKNKLQ